MFEKDKSRFLTTASGLLFGQMVVGIVYFLFIVSQLLMPGGEIATGREEWIRTLATVVFGAALFLVLRWKPGIFDPKLTRAEKLFRLIMIGAFDIAGCMTASYLLSLPSETSALSVKSVLNALASSAAVAGVSAALFLIAPKLKVFRESFSRVLNGVNLALLIGLGWELARLIGTSLEGPNGSSELIYAAFFEQLLRFAVTGVILGGVLAVLVRNGEWLSAGDEKKQPAQKKQYRR